MRTKIVRQAVNAGATPILQAARRLIPKRTRISEKALGKRGRTRNGEYTVKIGARSGYQTIVNGRLHDPRHTLHLVELPVKPHVIMSRRGIARQHPGTQPHPFLAPALESNVSQAKSIMGQKIMQGLQEAAHD